MKIENAKGAQVKSKLSGLIDSFTASPFNVAPERQQDMVEIRDRFGLRISMDDTTKDWIFEARSYFGAHHEIKLSLRSLERLWGCCYAYTAIFAELQEADINGTDVHQSPEYILALGLLDWIAQDTLQDIECPWPDHLPNPEHREQLRHIRLADHLFLMTAGRILLHEIGHLVLDHFSDQEPTAESLIKYEYEADAWADDWMLGKWEDYNQDEKVFIGRTMGIAFNHAIILFFGSKQKLSSNTHPNPIDRLNSFVRRYMPPDAPSTKNPKLVACGFLLAIIGHLVIKKGTTPDFGDLSSSYPEIFASFRSLFN
jgi:Peptidase U49